MYAKLILLFAIAPGTQLPAPALGPDSAVFELYRDGRLVGEQDLSVERLGSGEFLVTVSTRIPSAQPARSSVQVTIGAQGEPRISEYRSTPADRRAGMRFSPRRVAARFLAGSAESAREFPVSGPVILLADSFPALLAAVSVREPGVYELLSPADGARHRATLVHGRTEMVDVGGRSRELLPLEVRTESGTLRAWFDAAGRLQLATTTVYRAVRRPR